MLLAVLGLAEAGKLAANEVVFGPPLLERYRKFFDAVRGQSDLPNPNFPFFHLHNDGFWRLVAVPGREAALEAMDSARSAAAIADNIHYARLDPALHRLLLDPAARDQLRQQLVVAWFGPYTARLNALFTEERGIDRYEQSLRAGVESGGDAPTAAEPEPVRSAAFRRVVTEAYDYRCAASGWRIVLPDGACMVEAAHLIPFNESHDDDPRNGIALAPSFHWAMDRNVIVPGPDFKWHVSDTLDGRLADHEPLLELDGKDLILPRNRNYAPRSDALEWRLRALTRKPDTA